MNILVTGSQGQLGLELQAAAAGSRHRWIWTDVNELDITDREAVHQRVMADKVDIIVNCAAYTDVERAEDDLDLAQQINATAVGNLADAIKQRDGYLIHVSTDYVFGAHEYNTPITEEEEPAPLGVYGLTKLRGEWAVAESECRAIIIRTAWLYSPHGRNFLKTMLRLTSSRPEVNVVFDQVGTPTSATDLAAAIYHIIERGLYEGHEGLYHFTDEGVCSWYDFAYTIGRMAGHDECQVRPCHSSEFPSKVKRPSYSVLDKSLFKQTFSFPIPHWTASLADVIERLEEEAPSTSNP